MMEDAKSSPLPFWFWLILGQPLIALGGTVFYTLGYFVYMDTIIVAQHSAPSSHKWAEQAIMMGGYAMLTYGMLWRSRVLAWVCSVGVFCASLRSGKKLSLAAILLMTCFSGFFLWYGYDHFVPDVRMFDDARPPYQHGLTWLRYGTAVAIELIINIGYWWPLRKLRLHSRAAQT